MEQVVASPCPMCNDPDGLRLRTHIDTIPYFGEHTQVTLLCMACGWRQTDLIPAEAVAPCAWSLAIDGTEALTVRVVRSTGCTVRIPELDLEVAPGSSSTGYVSNVEGVLVRFSDVLDIVERDLLPDETDAIATLQALRVALAHAMLGRPVETLTLELLDPTGRSAILSDDAAQRPLTEDELAHLPLGPEVPVFSA
jgi:zinc finger protein